VSFGQIKNDLVASNPALASIASVLLSRLHSPLLSIWDLDLSSVALLVEAEPEWRAMGDKWRDFEVESEWGSVILLARRK
jgi:hypothetical protein